MLAITSKSNSQTSLLQKLTARCGAILARAVSLAYARFAGKQARPGSILTRKQILLIFILRETSLRNPKICVSGSCQAFAASPALRQVSSRNCSRVSLCSIATCGSKSPRLPPLEIRRPCLPISTSSGRIGSGGESSESSICKLGISSERTGENRGSCSAALAAHLAMASPKGSTGSTTPMQPRKRPRA